MPAFLLEYLNNLSKICDFVNASITKKEMMSNFFFFNCELGLIFSSKAFLKLVFVFS